MAENSNQNSVTVDIVKSPSCIKIKTNDIEFIARVSTGNRYSMFSKKVLDNLKLGLDEEKEESIPASFGSPFESIGKKTVTIHIQNVVVTHKFFVVKSLAEDFLFGCDVIFGKLGGMTLENYGKQITFGQD